MDPQPLVLPAEASFLNYVWMIQTRRRLRLIHEGGGHEDQSTQLELILGFLWRKLSSPSSLVASFRTQYPVDHLESPLEPSGLPHLDSVQFTSCFRGWPYSHQIWILDCLRDALPALSLPPAQIADQIADLGPRTRMGYLAYFSRPGGEHESGRIPMPGLNYINNLDSAHIVMICLHATAAVWGDLGDDQGLGDRREPVWRLFKRLLRVLGARRCFEQIARSQKAMDSSIERSLCHPERSTANMPGTSRTSLRVESDDAEQGIGSEPESALGVMVEVMKNLARLSKAAGQHARTETNQQMNSEIKHKKRPPEVMDCFLAMIQTTIVREWDGNPELNRWSAIGSAIELSRDLYRSREILGIPEEQFAVPELAARVDSITAPISFLSCSRRSRNHQNGLHILEHPHLFPLGSIVEYFRSASYHLMLQAHLDAGATRAMCKQMLDFASHTSSALGPKNQFRTFALSQLAGSVRRYLLVDCQRGSVLQSAFDHLWDRDKFELQRPIKVQMGYGHGEEGCDQGGVSQEFFFEVFREALSPEAGFFVSDPDNDHLTYFRPGSPVEEWQYGLLGVLVGLALHNGCTIPIRFPLALYRKILGWPTDRLEHIEDWGPLARGLRALLEWGAARPAEAEDVEQVFMRQYCFSYEGLDRRPKHIDIWRVRHGDRHAEEEEEEKEKETENEEEHHHQHHQELQMVTNANRAQFVTDYISWLTERSVKPGLEAFLRGFRAVVDERRLSLLPKPTHLQAMLEGRKVVSAQEMYEETTYESGYSASHPMILWFWAVVSGYDERKLGQLLRFVTATDRLPPVQASSPQPQPLAQPLGEEVPPPPLPPPSRISIARAGPDSDHLPTSRTCFRTLLLPEYSSKSKLAQKLDIALEHGIGFGFL